jgi:hypothetical protein
VIEAAGVVVPAHNEETLLPACLRALRRAARQASVPVYVLVAAGPGLGRRPWHGYRGGLERASGARAGRVRGPLRNR